MENNNHKKTRGLIVVDMVNGFINEGVLADKYIDTITDEIERLVKAYLANGDKVIGIKDCHKADSEEFKHFPPHCIKGTSESEMVDQLKPYEKHMTVIEKDEFNAFNAPGFQEAIKGLNDLVVVGCCTDICVQSLVVSLQEHFKQNEIDAKVKVPVNGVETFHNLDIGHDRHESNTKAFKVMSEAGAEIVDTVEVSKRANVKNGLLSAAMAQVTAMVNWCLQPGEKYK